MKKYSMADLAKAVNKTEYHIRKNVFNKEPFKTLLLEHKKKEKNTGKVFYDEVILDALKEYYDITEPTQEPEKKETVADGVGVGDTENENPKNTETNPPPPDSKAAQGENLGRLIDILERQITNLEKQINDKEIERQYWIKQFEEMRKKNDELNEQLRLTAPAPQEIEIPQEGQATVEEPAPAKMTFKEWLKQRFRK